MKSTPRLVLCGVGLLAGVTVLSPTHLVAQTAAPADNQVLTVQLAKDFLTAAGLQTCEVTEMDQVAAQYTGALTSLSLGVAKDCADYDPANPTVVNVHHFADQTRRDAMVTSLQSLRFRALRPYGSIWAVDNLVIVLLGPHRQEVEALIKAEYLRRHPGAE